LSKQFILFLFCAFSTSIYTQNNSVDARMDSIESLRKLSKKSGIDLELRLKYAKQASNLSEETGIDSTILNSNQHLSFVYLYLGEYDLLRDISHENLKLAQKLQDSIALGKVQQSLAWYHRVESQNDSAYYYYYNAKKIYDGLNDELQISEALMNMADLQETAKDYIGSEQNAIQAIKLIQKFPENDDNLDALWSLYNLLAVISERLENHDEAIKYYQETKDIANKMSDPYGYFIHSSNNLAFSYGNNGDYPKALSIYKGLISDERLFKVAPDLYTIVLGNIANTNFLLKNESNSEIESQFKEAFRIGDSLDDSFVKMAILGDMSNFYFETGNKVSALKLAKENYNLAKKSKSNDFVLKTLKLMSNLEDGITGKNHLNEYIKLSDSLILKERAIRNKFARLEFETDKIEADNAQLSKERLLFIFISIGLLMSLTLLYIVITQRSKNRKLEFIQKQQASNEEIYNLMLAQQDKIDEGRAHEKKRIAAELHDGILGRLFGTRLSLDSLNLVQSDAAINSRSQYINELKTIETEIRQISHDLNTDFVSGSSFITIVKSLIETQTRAYELAFSFDEDNSIDWEGVPNKTKIHMYRILQESMQNIYKHAKANRIKISFKLNDGLILFIIEDDGCGFNVGKARKGIGLKNIDSRVQEIGGIAEVHSETNKGTIIKISIPL